MAGEDSKDAWAAEARELGIDDTGSRDVVRRRVRAYKSELEAKAALEAEVHHDADGVPVTDAPPPSELDGSLEDDVAAEQNDAGEDPPAPLDEDPDDDEELELDEDDVRAIAAQARRYVAGGNATIAGVLSSAGLEQMEVVDALDVITVWRRALELVELVDVDEEEDAREPLPIVVVTETTAAAVYLVEPTLEPPVLVDFS